MWQGPPPAEEDVEMLDAAQVELEALPSAIRQHLSVGPAVSETCSLGAADGCVLAKAEPEDADALLLGAKTTARNSPMPFAYEPAVSLRTVDRPLASLLRRTSMGEILEESLTLEEHGEQLLRRQIFSRRSVSAAPPPSIWERHEHFYKWARALVIVFGLSLSAVVCWGLYQDFRYGMRVMLLDESQDEFYRTRYAQTMYEQNLCDTGPPVELLQRCAELDRIRNKNYNAVAPAVGVSRLIRAFASTLFRGVPPLTLAAAAGLALIIAVSVVKVLKFK